MVIQSVNRNTRLIKIPNQKVTPNSLSYELCEIKIRDFQCIKKLDLALPTGNNWLFFCGENGEGKTAFLQAVAIGMCGSQHASRLLEDNKRCRIEVCFLKNFEQKIHRIYWNNKTNNWSGIKEHPQFFYAYGPSRLSIMGEDSEHDGKQIASEESLINQKGNLRNIEKWIKEQKLIENSPYSNPEEKRIAALRISNVIDLLVDLMPHISSIELIKDKIVYKEKGFDASIHEIASGHKTVLAMIGDIICRSFELDSSLVDPQNFVGIVVIDELDLHLHPKWQREFPNLLSKHFPKVQFICSTHSPLPLLGAPKNSKFYIVKRDETDGTSVIDSNIDITTLQPNAILTSPLFDLDSIISVGNKDFSSIRTQDDYRQIKKQEEQKERYRNYLKNGLTIPKELLKEIEFNDQDK